MIALATHREAVGLAIIALAAVIAVATAVGRGRVSRPLIRTGTVTAGLFGAFGVWTALLGDGGAAVGIVMFATAVGTFRLMNYFER